MGSDVSAKPRGSRRSRCGGASARSWRWKPAAVGADADAAVKADAAQDPIAIALRRLHRVGPVLSLVLRAEIGAIDRFAHGPSLACYAGIVSRVDASAGQLRYGRITRTGSPWLRWALVEVAVRAMKRPDALGRWARRLAIHKGIKKARVALARRLCDEISPAWRVRGTP